MKIDIAQGDLQIIRDHVNARIETIESREPSFKYYRDDIKVLRKLIRKLNAALKKVHGHDCGGDRYST